MKGKLDWESVEVALDFLPTDENKAVVPTETYKILVVDDDEEVHTVTKLMLRDFEFYGRKLQFIDAYSGLEAIEVLKEHDDIAVLLLDVVMESKDAGLRVVDYVRNVIGNQFVRIILRTGQPGEAPEEEVIRRYDINDYRLKTSMTVMRMNTMLYTALRNFRDLMAIEQNRQGIGQLLQASGELFRNRSIQQFFDSVLQQMIKLTGGNSQGVAVQDGFIVAATAKYERAIGHVVDHHEALDFLANVVFEGELIERVEHGYIVRHHTRQVPLIIFLSGHAEIDTTLLRLYLQHYTLVLDNFFLQHMVKETQEEVIYALSEVVEQHFEDTAGHIKRVANMMYQFAKILSFPPLQCDVIRIASTMHDIGKIGIPDAILKKPGRLTAEEFEVIKQHPTIGYNILRHSQLPILQEAATIAHYHHERMDGSGYPHGLKGNDIPLTARMMAIVDIFDALMHKRCYKEAYSLEETLAIIMEQKGTLLDYELVETFMRHLDEITQ